MTITVKGYDRRVEVAPIQGGRRSYAPSAEDFGADAGKGLVDAGLAAYKSEIARQDQIAVLEADRKLSEWENKRLYDPKDGALGVKGKDAFGLPDTVNKEYTDFTTELEKSLANERQRDVFRRAASSRSKDINTTLSRHVFTEVRNFDNSETTNYLKNSQQAAALNYNDPNRVGLEIERQHAAISDFAKRNGIVGSETEKQMRAQAISDTHVGVIDRFLANGQDQAASDYFNGKGDAGKNLYKTSPGLVEPGNINLAKRPVAKNPDGSISTVRSMSFEEDGKEVVVPTVINGKIVDDKTAIEHYRKTGEFLGKFDTPENADKFANALHVSQAAFYGGAKAQIAGDDIIKVEAKLKTASTEGAGMRAADDVWKELGPKKDLDPINADQMFEKLRGKFGDDPKVMKAAQQALSERMTIHNTAQRERREANSSQVWDAIGKGAALPQLQGMQAWLDLPGHERQQIREHLQDRSYTLQQRAQQGVTDLKTYYDLIGLATSPSTRDTFAKTNLLEYRGKLAKGDFEELAKLQGAIRKGDDNSEQKLAASARAQKEMVDGAVLSMGLDPTPNEKTNKDKAQQVLDFRRAVRDTVRAEEQQTGKPVQDKRLQEIVDNMIVEGKVKGSGLFFDDKKKVYQLKPGENLVVKYNDIPEAERTKAEDALRRAGRKVSADAVQALYVLKMQKMRGLPPTVGNK
jgi:hypothetical protein